MIWSIGILLVLPRSEAESEKLRKGLLKRLILTERSTRQIDATRQVSELHHSSGSLMMLAAMTARASSRVSMFAAERRLKGVRRGAEGALVCSPPRMAKNVRNFGR